ncbi:DUF2846 domain-containing protein [Alkalimarinus alittae]|uniref:DUF2846 domain-containing protein n=1 Tax=Alkalimarinus alittae TaxID=2961619 RepID=A0ABY6MY20_9ALTE|nr:DUF2846 domain-containing protein [Alkalimarinus alittae]UZE94718.1 DUF2846 domain-containing protein [Alkalimarinus alittae]
MRKTFLLLLLLTYMQLGCATFVEPVLFESPVALKEGQAAVYLYRTDLYDLKDAYPFVFLNGESQGALEHKHYKLWMLDTGQYEWMIKAGSAWDELMAVDDWEIREKKITLDVSAGKYYFLRLKPSTQAHVMGWRDAKLELVAEDNAIKGMGGNALSINNE